jgi:glycosyltransferase involved in cell wall biosynthesis
MPGDTAVIIPARNESDRVGATVTAALGLTGVDLVVVVDDGSRDATGIIAAKAGAQVVRHPRGRGKAAAMESGAQAVARIEAAEPDRAARFLLFLDADLGASAAEAGELAEPVRAGAADATIAVFTDLVCMGGFGFVTGAAGAGIERATGWRPAQPLNGQRCLTREAFAAARPLARGWGAETGMTIDLLRQGLRIAEVEVPLSHRATGNDVRSQLHRLAQLRDVIWALAVRARRRPSAGPSAAVR